MVSLTTVPESSSNAIRLGMLIRPLKVSAMLHSRPRSTVAPRMDTKEYTTKKGFATLSLWQRNTRKREPYRPQPMMVEKAEQQSATAVKMEAEPP